MNDTNKLTKLGARRLLRLAKILDTADATHRKKGEPPYDQEAYKHPCGAPACAWGHYLAHSKTARTRFEIEDGNYWGATLFAPAEFDISDEEACELFDSYGCGNARTAKQAAAYIRAFVKRKGVE
jgi:hypothetical protein